MEIQLLNDQELWKRIASGDDRAFDAWYRETAPRLRVFLRHLLANEQAAEDVMQETFTQIWQRPTGFDPERGPLRAYLFGVARRQAAEFRRHQRPAEELVVERANPDRIENSSLVAELFGRLAKEQRAILWLREVEGQSYEELAVILDIPVGTVRSRLFAAREALRVMWHGTPVVTGGQHELQ